MSNPKWSFHVHIQSCHSSANQFLAVSSRVSLIPNQLLNSFLTWLLHGLVHVVYRNLSSILPSKAFFVPSIAFPTLQIATEVKPCSQSAFSLTLIYLCPTRHSQYSSSLIPSREPGWFAPLSHIPFLWVSSAAGTSMTEIIISHWHLSWGQRSRLSHSILHPGTLYVVMKWSLNKLPISVD